jgi:fatty acid desaturase
MSSRQPASDVAPPSRPSRSLQRILMSAVLGFEGLVALFAGLVAMTQSSLGKGPSLLAAAVLMLACFLAAGLLRTPIGVGLGWLVQVLMIAAGFWVPMMFFLGIVFGALWVTAVRTGGRIDREKSAFVASAAGQASSGTARLG